MDQALRDLLDLVCANPGSTEARLVFADALQERGEPLGQFIASQCGARRGRHALGITKLEERRLLETHRDAWLLQGMSARDAVFERGFVKACSVNAVVDASDPRWSLVESLRGAGPHALPLFTQPALTRLTALRDVDVQSFPLVASIGRLPLLSDLSLSGEVGLEIVRMAHDVMGGRLKTLRCAGRTIALRDAQLFSESAPELTFELSLDVWVSTTTWFSFNAGRMTINSLSEARWEEDEARFSDRLQRELGLRKVTVVIRQKERTHTLNPRRRAPRDFF